MVNLVCRRPAKFFHLRTNYPNDLLGKDLERIINDELGEGTVKFNRIVHETCLCRPVNKKEFYGGVEVNCYFALSNLKDLNKIRAMRIYLTQLTGLTSMLIMGAAYNLTDQLVISVKWSDIRWSHRYTFDVLIRRD